MDFTDERITEESYEALHNEASEIIPETIKDNDLRDVVNMQELVMKTESLTSLTRPSLTKDSKSRLLYSDEEVNVSSCCETIATSKIRDVSPRASMDQALKSEKAFIEYVMSLPPTAVISGSPQLSKAEAAALTRQKQKHSTVPQSTSSTTKVGLDHLDNLCKLMEQLSELRETNTKLQKRVQYLEDLKTLHEMHKELRREVKYGSENVLNQRKHMGLKKCLTSVDYVRGSPRRSDDYVGLSTRGSEEFSFQEQQQRPIKGRSSPSNRRSRTFAVAPYDGHRRERSKSVGHEETLDSRSKRIFPKWSRVKEAFGWESERKYGTARGNKVFYSTTCHGPTITGIGLPHDSRRVLTDRDFAALRMPVYSDYSEKDEMSTMDSYAGEAMASCTDSGIPTLSSSTEDISSFLENYRSGLRYFKRDSGSSENRLSLLETRTDGLRRLKSATAPGSANSRVYQEMLDQKKSLTIDRSIDPEQAFAKFEKEESKKSHKSPWCRVKTIIERRRDSLKRRHLRRGPCLSSPPSRYRNPRCGDDIDDDVQDVASYDSQRKSSGDQIAIGSSIGKTDIRFNEDMEKKRKKQNISLQGKDVGKQHTSTHSIKKAPPPIQVNSEEKDCGPDSRIMAVPDREVVFRTPSSSPQFNRKSTWMRMKNVLRSKKDADGLPGLSSQSMPSSPNGVQDGTFDFDDVANPEDNVEDVEYENSHTITRVGSDSYVHKLALSASSAPVTDLMIELQRNVSDDFSRKMQEWERIRNTGIRSATSPKLERKNSGSKTRKKPDKQKVERYEKSPKPKVKDLAWLEKELQKIEKEKQRLSKEKEKYEERAVRLERLRQTVLTAQNSNKKEVLVRTSAGEFRFEGISDAFTKKLYEWETKKGLGPEFSTIALLDSSLGGNNKNCLSIQQIEKGGNLQRALSRSESSIADIGQPSHTSSNSLPSLKPPEIGDLEKSHHSRANSEPDLSSFAGLNNVSVSENTLADKNDDTKESSRDTLEADIKDPYVHPEVTQLIDSDVDDALRDMEDHGRCQRDENYYSLLEENVILLEQLKNKEEICRRLEKELQLLDEKVDEMNKHHLQEMERYREKLWEMHKPGNTPREVQGCLQVMAELRSRIENLEKCSEKLKNEKETLEDSFRFHSAEQEHMTLDLIGKMRELHAAGENPTSQKMNKKEIFVREQEREPRQANFDIKIVERLQDLSNQLVKQTKVLEEALAERTRQICRLRWELLHRDVSTVKLETELHSAHIKGNKQQPSKCEAKRAKYAHFRSWSSEETSSRSRQMKECTSRGADMTKSDLPEAYYKLPKTEIRAIELSNTVHELNRELIRLSSAAESLLGGDASTVEEDANQSTGKERVVKSRKNESQTTEQVASFDASSNIETGTHCDASPTTYQGSEAKSSKISVRRNSASSISLVSTLGAEEVEPSHLHNDVNKVVTNENSPSKHSRKLVKNDSWSNTDSSTEDESFTRVSLYSRPDRSARTSKQDSTAMQPALKKSFSFEYATDSDDSQEREMEKQIKSPPQTRKRKINYKALKTARKQNKNGSTNYTKGNENSSKICDEVSLRDRVTDFRDIVRNSENSSGLLPVQKGAQHTENALKIPITREQVTPALQRGFPKVYKSHSDRRSTSDSKISQRDRIGIRKSESLACTKDKKRFRDYCCHDETTKAFEATKEQLSEKTRKNYKKTINGASTRMFEMPALRIETSTDKFNDHRESFKKAILETTSPITHNKETRMEAGNTVLDNVSQCSSAIKNAQIQNDDRMIKKTDGTLQVFDNYTVNTSQLFKEKTYNCPENPQSSTYVIKLPKRKHKTPNQTKISVSSQEQVPAKKIPAEQTVTVVIPRRKYSKIEDRTQCTESVGAYSDNIESFGECLQTDNALPFALQSGDTLDAIEQTSNRNITQELQDQNLEVSKLYISTPEQKNISKGIQGKKNENSSYASFFEDSRHLKSECSSEERSQHSLPVSSTLQSPTTAENCVTQNYSNYFKSPSDTQIDWKKTCAKKTSKESAPNVKTLIEKYNQKVLENQTARSPCSSAYNSPAAARKIPAPTESTGFSIKSIPFSFSSTPSSPRIITAFSNHNPLIFKPSIDYSFHSPNNSPPTSPSSRARSEALLKAKEKFISSSSITAFTTPNILTQENSKYTTANSPMQTNESREQNKNTTKRSVTDPEIMKNETRYIYRDESTKHRASMSSNKSSDSMSLVLRRTGETCQESRLSKRNEKHKSTECSTAAEESQLTATKSLSTSSIFKTLTGRDIFPSSLFRLRRSRRKKDMGTVTQLCRQSLMLEDEVFKSPEETKLVHSPRSCPSSPETKNKAKPSWLQRNIFRQK